MNNRPRYLKSSTAALTTTPQVVTCSSVSTTESEKFYSTTLPKAGTLVRVKLQLSAIVTAGSLTFHLCSDAAGDYPITPEITEDIVLGKTTATDGGVVSLLNMPYALPAEETGSSVYIVVETTAGTATLDYATVEVV